MGSGDIEVQGKARTLKLINTHNREHIDIKTKHAIETKNSTCFSFKLSAVALVSSEDGYNHILFDYVDYS